MDNVKPGGLGEYFRDQLGKSPKFASHFASIMVNQGRLIYRFGVNHRAELKVKLYRFISKVDPNIQPYLYGKIS